MLHELRCELIDDITVIIIGNIIKLCQSSDYVVFQSDFVIRSRSYINSVTFLIMQVFDQNILRIGLYTDSACIKIEIGKSAMRITNRQDNNPRNIYG